MAAASPAQLSRWYEAYCDAMVLYARQWLDAGAAEDVVQEVFMRLVRQRAEPRNVKAWLFKAVRNAALNELRSRSRRQDRRRVWATDRQAYFQPGPEDGVDAELAAKALEALQPGQRELVVLRIWAEMTLDEICQIVHLPRSTVHSRYKAAIESLQKVLGASCRTKTD